MNQFYVFIPIEIFQVRPELNSVKIGENQNKIYSFALYGVWQCLHMWKDFGAHEN